MPQYIALRKKDIITQSYLCFIEISFFSIPISHYQEKIEKDAFYLFSCTAMT